MLECLEWDLAQWELLLEQWIQLLVCQVVILLYLENLYIPEKVLKQWLQEKLLLEWDLTELRRVERLEALPLEEQCLEWELTELHLEWEHLEWVIRLQDLCLE